MFDRVAIIGCGLIGSSVLRRLKKNGSIKKLVTYDNDKSVTNIIKKENLSDEIALSSSEAVKNSDLVLISTPMRSFESVINSIKDNLKPGSILTDTCSVKHGVNNIVKKINLKNSIWIPGHPVAGTEKSGPSAGFSDLFQDRWTIITPDKKIKDSDIKKIILFWESMGSKVKIMSVDEHDKFYR
jgi:cyclohexadieny/prephenate dehydrogenase